MPVGTKPNLPVQPESVTPVAQDARLEHSARMAEVYLAYLSLTVIVIAFAFAMIGQQPGSGQVVSNTSTAPTR